MLSYFSNLLLLRTNMENISAPMILFCVPIKSSSFLWTENVMLFLTKTDFPHALAMILSRCSKFLVFEAWPPGIWRLLAKSGCLLIFLGPEFLGIRDLKTACKVRLSFNFPWSWILGNLKAFDKANYAKLIMQRNIGEIRLTWASVEPDSVIF